MSTDFDQLAARLEEELWAEYTDTAIDHAKNPRNMGQMEQADGYARLTGTCGDTMTIWLNIENDTIAEIRFRTDGCGSSVAAGSMVTDLAKGKSIGEALEITPLDVLNALGGLPQDNTHCAWLAAGTLAAAIESYLSSGRPPASA